MQAVESISDDIPVIYATNRALLLNTGQRQSDMDGHNDASRNTHHCRGCASLQYGGGNVDAREFSSLRTHFRPAYCVRLLYVNMGHVNNFEL